MSLNNVFNVKDKVFARRRCFPPWPGIIYCVNTNTLSQKTYNVYLYGTGDYIECKEELLIPYEENKSKFSKIGKKKGSYKLFDKALFEIENTTDISSLFENDVQVCSSTPSSTEQIFHPDKSKDVDIIQDEYHSESKGKSMVNMSNKFKDNEDFITQSNVNFIESKQTKRKKSECQKKKSVKKLMIQKPPKIESLKLNETQLNLNEENKSQVKNSDLDKFEDIDKIKKISNCSSVIEGMLKENESSLSKKNKKISTPKRRKKGKLSKKSIDNVLQDTECLKETESSVKFNAISDQSFKNGSINVHNLKLNENQPIVLVEVLNDQLLAKITNEKQSTVSNSNVVGKKLVGKKFHKTSVKDAKTINVTKTTIESSDVSSLDKKTSKSNKTSPNSQLRHASCKSQSSKTKKISKFKKKSSHPRLTIQLSKATKDHNASTNATDDVLEQNCKTKDTSSSLETENTLKLTPIPSLHINNSVSEENSQLSNKITKLPPALNEILTDFVTSVEVKCKEQDSEDKKMAQMKLLQIELDMLDYIYKLRSALSFNNFSYEMALESLEQINQLEINALMLIKHPSIIDTIMKVAMYVGNVSKWKLSKPETIKHAEQCAQVRHKAQVLNHKFVLLFTKQDIGKFKEIYDKKVNEFKTKTMHLARDQIYGCTSILDL